MRSASPATAHSARCWRNFHPESCWELPGFYSRPWRFAAPIVTTILTLESSNSLARRVILRAPFAPLSSMQRCTRASGADSTVRIVRSPVSPVTISCCARREKFSCCAQRTARHSPSASQEPIVSPVIQALMRGGSEFESLAARIVMTNPNSFRLRALITRRTPSFRCSESIATFRARAVTNVPTRTASASRSIDLFQRIAAPVMGPPS